MATAANDIRAKTQANIADTQARIASQRTAMQMNVATMQAQARERQVTAQASAERMRYVKMVIGAFALYFAWRNRTAIKTLVRKVVS